MFPEETETMRVTLLMEDNQKLDHLQGNRRRIPHLYDETQISICVP